MHIRQLRQQLQMVSYFTSLLQNLEWSNEPRCELASDLKMTQTSHMRHLEVDKISHFKAQLSSPTINVTLLPPLRISQVLPNHTNLLLDFLQNVGPKHLPFSSLTPNTTEFDTYDHTTSQMVPSSRFLDRCCYRRTRHTTYSYPNSFHIASHNLLAYLLVSD
jgi:hypothetical protein